MEKKIAGIFVCMLLVIPVLSVTATVYEAQEPLDPSYWPTEGSVGVEYTFCIDIPEDLNGDVFYVLWDWGDSSDTGRLGPYVSGETVCASHIWNEPGDYEILVKIKNEFDEIVWQSDPFIIHIGAPELLVDILFGRHLTVTIRNVGDGDAYDVNWSFDIDGGIFGLVDYHIGGTVDILLVGKNTSVDTSQSPFGFGSIEITGKVDASNAEECTYTVNGMIFFFRIVLK